MDPKDRQRINDEVLSIIRVEFYPKFRDIFELTHQVTGTIPLTPSNELRNAFDHLRSALIQDDVAEAERDLINAKAHMLHALIDCYILMTNSRIDLLSDIFSAIRDKIITAKPDISAETIEEFLASWIDIKVSRDKIYQIGPVPLPTGPDEKITADVETISRTCNDFAGVLLRSNELYEQLLDAFTLEQIIKARAQALWERAGRPEGSADDYWFRAESEIIKARHGSGVVSRGP